MNAEQNDEMTATILMIEYGLSQVQRDLPPEAWRARAEQISGMPGLRWKYWLRQPEGDGRGGVYLFDTRDDAERAADILVASLEEAGARDVKRRTFDVDPGLSSVTRGAL